MQLTTLQSVLGTSDYATTEILFLWGMGKELMKRLTTIMRVRKEVSFLMLDDSDPKYKLQFSVIF